MAAHADPPGDSRDAWFRHYQQLAVTGAAAYELERRLGRRSQRFIQCYTNPPQAIAASYVEGM